MRRQGAKIRKREKRREIEAGWPNPCDPGLETRAALHEGKATQIAASIPEHVIDNDPRRQPRDQLPIRFLAVQSLLQIVEAAKAASLGYQQLAIQDAIEIDGCH